jgi:phage terminase Nu1 subunit (DNA packaging protein)
MNTDKPKPNLVEMAKKRRHLHLVEKLSQGKSSTPTLSKSEIKELANLETQEGSPVRVDTHEKVARAFGVSVRTIYHWIKDGMPICRGGKYDLLEIRTWRLARSPKTGSRKNSAKENWETIFRKHKALLARIEFEERMGQLILRGVVEKELIALSMAVKTALLSLPKELAPQLEGLSVRQINDIMNRRIKEVIRRISDGKLILKNILIKKGPVEKTTLRSKYLDTDA